MVKRKVNTGGAKDVIMTAIKLVADTVCDTMGPGGRNVIMESGAGMPMITKDGVTVANSIEPKDEELALAVKIIKEAADKTNKEAGDGTTTSIALVEKLYTEGRKYVAAGHNVTELKREIDAGKNKIIAELKKQAQKIEDSENRLSELEDVATISMNGDVEMAKLVASAIDQVGPNGIVNVQESNDIENSLEKEEGIKIKSGWVSPFFCKKRDDKKIVLEDCSVLITSHLLKNVAQISLIEDALKPLIKNGKPLLIISSECSGTFLSNMVANNKQGQLTNCAIRPPYFGNIRKEFYTDLAIITGATVVEAEEGHDLGLITADHLGLAKRVEITDTTTTIIGGCGDPVEIQERIDQLKKEFEANKTKDLDKTEERLAKMQNGVVLLRLARRSNIEMVELKDRLEDAVNACKAALEDGIIAGGGAALVYASKVLDPSIPGENILIQTCLKPMERIAGNAGFSGDVAIDKIKEKDDFNYTIDALSKEVVSIKESGIVDPVKVTCAALDNAVSVASTLLTTKSIISIIPEENQFNPYQMYG